MFRKEKKLEKIIELRKKINTLELNLEILTKYNEKLIKERKKLKKIIRELKKELEK